MSLPQLQISYTLSNIGNAADQFWQYAHQYRVLAFSGSMGAGKTTFIHAVCNHLGVKDAVSSPTFALINEYHFPDQKDNDKIIWHMDWYRLKDSSEVIDTGMEDAMLRSDTYSFIEWPEKAEELIPAPHLWITIEAEQDDQRTLSVYLKD